MNLLDHAKATIPAPDRKTDVRHTDGNTQDIVDTILFADSNLGTNMCDFANVFSKTYEGLYSIWYFVHKHINYLADEPGHEKVKDPRVTWRDKNGDCKSFSLFIGSILKCLEIPYKYRFAAYSGNEPTHVYVIAKLNKRDVILDSTIDKFDFEFSYHKKWDKMTKISYIHGTKAPAIRTRNAQPSTVERIANAPRIATSKSYIDYSNLTEGELTLKLLDEQIKILSNYFGDETGTYQKARNIIYSASKNLHSSNRHIGYLDPKLFKLIEYIDFAKERNKKAGVSGAHIADFNSDREELKKNCAHLTNQYILWSKSGNPIDILNPARGKHPNHTPVKPDGSNWNLDELYKAFKACPDQLFFMDLFNSNLENASAHLLYEYIENKDLNTLPGTANFKANNHKLANSSMARYSSLDRTNIVLWQRNGILRAGISKKLSDPSPEAIISQWKTNPKDGIGIIDPVSLTAIASILTAALGAASALVLGILQKKATFASEVRGYGTEAFGPEKGDFFSNELPNDSGFDFNSLLIPGALALGGFLLIK